MKKTLLTITICLGISIANAQNVSTYSSYISNLEGICADASGNIYVSSKTQHKIYKINTSGTETVLAGSGTGGNADGMGAAATFSNPAGLCADAMGNIYVADNGNNKIRKIEPNGNVTTYAGTGAVGLNNGNASTATFNQPWAVCIAPNGDLYVSDQWNFCVRKITTGGVVSTFGSLSFQIPFGICIDSNGNIFTGISNNDYVYKFDVNGNGSVFAGNNSNQGGTNGNGISASFYAPKGLCIDSQNNIYVAEAGGTKIRKITPNADVTTIAGGGGVACVDGPALSASFWGLTGICTNSTGNLFTSDYFCGLVRVVSGLTSNLNEEDEFQSNVKFYPNPTSELINVELEMINEEATTITITNALGQVVLTESVSIQHSSFNIQHFPAGMYFVNVSGIKGNNAVQKIIVQ